MNSIFNIYFIIINIISFIIYYLDKRLAIKHKYRIPEKILIMFSFIGGAIGSLISMMFFRHKTKHIKFIIINPILVCIWTYIILSVNHII
jgi:uncharacterized membrane protein YsdA (DUF1294 family)